MNCRRFNEFTVPQQNAIATFLFNKQYHLIKNLVERKLDDIKMNITNKEELQKEIQYVTSKYYIVDILSDCNWAVFDNDFNMYIFETQCK